MTLYKKFCLFSEYCHYHSNTFFQRTLCVRDSFFVNTIFSLLHQAMCDMYYLDQQEITQCEFLG